MEREQQKIEKGQFKFHDEFVNRIGPKIQGLTSNDFNAGNGR